MRMGGFVSALWITFALVFTTAVAKAEVSPIVALTSPELMSATTNYSCAKQSEILAELRATNSYEIALSHIERLNCPSKKLYAARALQRICDVQREYADVVGTISDCPASKEKVEWKEYQSQTFSSVSSYVATVPVKIRRARLNTGNKSKTVQRVQEQLRNQGCYKGPHNGILNDASTQKSLDRAHQRYTGKNHREQARLEPYSGGCLELEGRIFARKRKLKKHGFEVSPKIIKGEGLFHQADL